MHGYQDVNNKLPAGWVTKSGGPYPSPGYSWQTLILPYVEQQALLTAINPDLTTPGGPPATPVTNSVLLNPVPVYTCPSDAGQPLAANFNNYARTNYLANRFVLGPDVSNNPTTLSVQTISDGSSNTILAGERDATTNVGGSALIRHNNSSCSFEARFGRGLNPKPAAGTVWTNANDQRLAYASNHTGGANFLFGDGSVRFLANSLECDPAENWTTFPHAAGYAFGYVGQRLEVPNDNFPVNLP